MVKMRMLGWELILDFWSEKEQYDHEGLHKREPKKEMS